MVRPRLQPLARETKTKGNQCVGIAAWKNATIKPVAAMVERSVEFMLWIAVGLAGADYQAAL